MVPPSGTEPTKNKFRQGQGISNDLSDRISSAEFYKKRVWYQRGTCRSHKSIGKVPPKVGQADRRIEDELNELSTKRQSETIYIIQETTTTLSRWQNTKTENCNCIFNFRSLWMTNFQRCHHEEHIRWTICKGVLKISRRPALDRFKRQDSTGAQFKPYRYLNWYISFISNKSRTVILIISDLTIYKSKYTRIHTDSYLLLF